MNEPKYKSCLNCRWKNVDCIDYPCNKCTLHDEMWEWDRTTVDITVLLKGKATNGDVIKAMFPDYVFILDEFYNSDMEVMEKEMITENADIRFDLNWWNEPYKKGENNE